eukprot:8664144-Alexandrium_andersonii.AAC.1
MCIRDRPPLGSYFFDRPQLCIDSSAQRAQCAQRAKHVFGGAVAGLASRTPKAKDCADCGLADC